MNSGSTEGENELRPGEVAVVLPTKTDAIRSPPSGLIRELPNIRGVDKFQDRNPGPHSAPRLTRFP